MIKVGNRKIINCLSLKSLKVSRTRNIIAIIAVALTSILFTTIFTIGFGTLETFQHQSIRQSGGDGHAVLKYISDEQYNNIKDHPLISEISYNLIIADSVDNLAFLKRRVEMYYMDDTALKLGACEPTSGRRPIADNEIIADTKTLDLLDVPHEIGAEVPLIYTIKGKQIQSNFILSGYWESDPVFNVGYVIVSKSFVADNSEKLSNTYKEDNSMSGVLNSYIMFKNSWNLEGKLHKIIGDSGYVWYDENSPYFILSNVNWAYIISNFKADTITTMVFISALLLVILTGYLIIYNIFQISVIKDIRFYGLLKTIGTTGKQIQHIINRQAMIISIIGIPIGIIFGFVIGRSVVPLFISMSSYNVNSGIKVTLNPVIFLGSAIFSIITVYISARRPGKIAASVSPIEAVYYTDGSDKYNKQIKNSENGSKINRMALSNIARNKCRTILAIISMSLSIILLNSVYTLTSGFDIEKYISRSYDTDFLIGHSNYFNQNRFRYAEDELTETFVEAVKSQPGFEEGGRLYYNIYVNRCSVDYLENNINNSSSFNYAQDGKPILDLYGLEELPLNRLEIVDGEKDKNILIEKLKRGRYIIEGLSTDDKGNVNLNDSKFSVGDKVTINVDGKSYEFEILSKAKKKYFTNSNRMWQTDFTFYLPVKEYMKLVTRPVLMTYAFNASDNNEFEMEQFIKKYTDKIEPMMDYESKETFIKEFNNLRYTFLIVGGSLSIIIGFIGILNFTNSILTGIVTRRREFAMMQSIGMTDKQLKKLLLCEGIYYSLATIVFSFVFGILFSILIIRGIAGNLWFFSYRLIIEPMIWTYPALLFISILIPYIAFKGVNRQSIVVRLNEV